MKYIVGEVMSETPEGRPYEISVVQSLEPVNSFEDALRLAESITRNYDALGHDNAVEYVITTDRALQNVSEQHPELDVVWSSRDPKTFRERYLKFSSEQWTEKDDHTDMFEMGQDTPSVYFDIDGTLGKWYADARGYSSLEEIIDPANHYFRDIEPHPFMVMLAQQLQDEGVDVCIISAADRNTIRDKMEWVRENLPFIKDENVFFSPLGADKTKFIKDNAEISVLVDDYNVNLEAWKGKAIKAINTVNSHQDKFPEIDMTIPEKMMLQYGKEVLEIEEEPDRGTHAGETVTHYLQQAAEETVVRYLQQAAMVIEGKAEREENMQVQETSEKQDDVIPSSHSDEDIDSLAKVIFENMKKASEELEMPPENGKYFGDWNLEAVKNGLREQKATARLVDALYLIDDMFGTDPMYFGVHSAGELEYSLKKSGYLEQDYTRTSYTNDYRLLDRLRTDCEYLLDQCSDGMSFDPQESHLWAKNAEAQIIKMQELYDNLPIKPSWCTQQDIYLYAERMADVKYPNSDLAAEILDKFTFADVDIANLSDLSQAARHMGEEYVDVTLQFYDEGYKQLYERACFKEATGISFKDALYSDDIMMNAYAQVYTNGDVGLIASIDTNEGFRCETIFLSRKEQHDIKQIVEKTIGNVEQYIAKQAEVHVRPMFASFPLEWSWETDKYTHEGMKGINVQLSFSDTDLDEIMRRTGAYEKLGIEDFEKYTLSSSRQVSISANVGIGGRPEDVRVTIEGDNMPKTIIPLTREEKENVVEITKSCLAKENMDMDKFFGKQGDSETEKEKKAVKQEGRDQ